MFKKCPFISFMLKAKDRYRDIEKITPTIIVNLMIRIT